MTSIAAPQEPAETSNSTPSLAERLAQMQIPKVPEEHKAEIAGHMLSPEMAAAHSMNSMLDLCLAEAGIGPGTVEEMLQQQGQAAATGDLSHARRSLAAQAAMLERMFHHLFSIATRVQMQSPNLFERYLRLALKAQAQATRANEVLGRLCREPPAPRAQRPKAAAMSSPASTPEAEAEAALAELAQCIASSPAATPTTSGQWPVRSGTGARGLNAPQAAAV